MAKIVLNQDEAAAFYELQVAIMVDVKGISLGEAMTQVLAEAKLSKNFVVCTDGSVEYRVPTVQTLFLMDRIKNNISLYTRIWRSMGKIASAIKEMVPAWKKVELDIQESSFIAKHVSLTTTDEEADNLFTQATKYRRRVELRDLLSELNKGVLKALQYANKDVKLSDFHYYVEHEDTERLAEIYNMSHQELVRRSLKMLELNQMVTIAPNNGDYIINLV